MYPYGGRDGGFPIGTRVGTCSDDGTVFYGVVVDNDDDGIIIVRIEGVDYLMNDGDLFDAAGRGG